MLEFLKIPEKRKIISKLFKFVPFVDMERDTGKVNTF